MADSRMLPPHAEQAPIYLSAKRAQRLLELKAPKVLTLIFAILGNFLVSHVLLDGLWVCWEFVWAPPRIHLCDYVTQTNMIQGDGNRMIRRSLDMFELYSGCCRLSQTFRCKGYLAHLGCTCCLLGFNNTLLSHSSYDQANL